MPIAHLASGSPISFNRGGQAISERAAVQRQSNPSADAPGHSAKSEAPERRNPLVAAMMEAIQGLVPANPAGATPATPTVAAATATGSAATGAGAAATTTASTGTTMARAAVGAATTTGSTVPAAGVAASDTSGATLAPTGVPADLKHAAYAFAHELYSALRSAGSDHDHDDDRRPTQADGPELSGQDRHQGERGHHGRHGVSRGAYGGLAQRLEALAQTLGGATTVQAPAGANAAPPAPVTTPSTAPVVPAAVPSGAAALPSASAVPPAATGPAATPPAATPADSPLLGAFKTLLSALAPSTSSSATGTATAREKLADFLHQLAQSLGRGNTEHATGSPAPGSLLNVTA